MESRSDEDATRREATSMTNAEIARKIIGIVLSDGLFIDMERRVVEFLDAKDAKRDGCKENYELFVGLMRTASARIESSEAERDRYRVALEELDGWPMSGDYSADLIDIQQIVKRALKGTA